MPEKIPQRATIGDIRVKLFADWLPFQITNSGKHRFFYLMKEKFQVKKFCYLVSYLVGEWFYRMYIME